MEKKRLQLVYWMKNGLQLKEHFLLVSRQILVYQAEGSRWKKWKKKWKKGRKKRRKFTSHCEIEEERKKERKEERKKGRKKEERKKKRRKKTQRFFFFFRVFSPTSLTGGIHERKRKNYQVIWRQPLNPCGLHRVTLKGEERRGSGLNDWPTNGSFLSSSLLLLPFFQMASNEKELPLFTRPRVKSKQQQASPGFSRVSTVCALAIFVLVYSALMGMVFTFYCQMDSTQDDPGRQFLDFMLFLSLFFFFFLFLFLLFFFLKHFDSLPIMNPSVPLKSS